MNAISSKDLQELVNANIITEEKALEIETYFNNKKTGASSKLNIVFGILGALLVSLGIILVIAHNWDDLSVTLRTICAFLPLAAGQVLCVYSVIYKKDNSVWTEASAIVLFFAVAASISLISQVYHIDGSLASFLFTWILLTAAIVYLMRSSVVALLLLAISSWYATEISYGYNATGIPWLYLATLAFLTPHYLNYFKKRKTRNFFHWYNWCIALSALVCLGCFTGPHFNSDILLFGGYLSLNTLLYQNGKYLSATAKNFFSNPFLKIGTTDIIIILIMLSFEELWNDFDKNNIVLTSPFIYISALLFICCTYNFIKENVQQKWRNMDAVEASLYIFVLVAFTNSVIGVFIINAWLLVIALWYIRKGSAQNNFGLLNFGLLIIASVAISRFFDDRIPFVWRGFFFLATGIGFFAANYRLMKKRKQLAQKQAS